MQQLFESAVLRHQTGQLREAETLYRQILVKEPRNNHVLYLLAILSQQIGKKDVSIELTRQAIAIAPNVADYHVQLGSMLLAGGAGTEAASEFRKAMELRPDLIDLFAQLGNSLYLSRDLTGAAEAYRSFLKARPHSPEILNNLGTVMREANRLDEAIDAYHKALSLRPEMAQVWQNLGHTLLEKHEATAAADAYRKTIELEPASGEARFELGKALKEAGDLDGSIAALREALRLRPNWLEPLNMLGGILHTSAQMDEALACHENLLENAGDATLAAGMLHSLYFNPACSAERILKDHHRWNELYARHLARAAPAYANDPDPYRRLKIGYVSADFGLHASSLFTLPLLSNHDHQSFEIFCYSDLKQEDDLTALHRRCADAWRDIAKMSDQDVADLVHRDQIDVLVDLSLHTAGSRLLVFARKPAPVQVTWLAYAGTSGVDTIDYRLSDPYLDAPGNEAWYSEKTLRLPDCFWCYDPLSEDPPVGPSPAAGNDYVTFGSLNSFAKVSAPIVDVWAQVLASVAGSRLIMYAPAGSARQRVLDRMARGGVEPARIEFVHRQSRNGYLQIFDRIDIHLDTWPYNGGTTTFDSLWMGVPVVSLTGPTAVGRSGLSILSNLGLSELVADAPARYVEIASALARDSTALAKFRAALRPRLRASALMDASRFAKSFELALRTMWHEWLSSSLKRERRGQFEKS